MSQSSVEKWISRRLVQVPTPDRLSLRHANVETGVSDLIAKLKLGAGDPTIVAREAARELWEQAKEHAGAWPGRAQLYKVSAVLKTGKSEGTFSFRASLEGRGGGTAMSLAEGSEPPTQAGIVAQHMRFAEASIRMGLEASAETIMNLREELKAARAESERDADRRFKFIETYEQMMDHSAERQLEFRKFEDQASRKNLMATKLIETVAPALGQKLPSILDALTGASGPSTKEVLAKLWNVLSSLPEEQRDALQRSLTPEARKDLEALVDAMTSAPPGPH